MTSKKHQVGVGSRDDDAPMVADTPLPTALEPLSKDLIVESAVTYTDEHGLARLTMRNLGRTLGVEAMSLYRHVGDKGSLLDAMVELAMTELSADPAVTLTPVAGWEAYLHQLAHGIRRVALRHPNVFPLMAARTLEAAWLRPPLQSLDWAELFLNGLLSQGFSDDAAIAAYRVFSSFLLGHLLLEVAVHGVDGSPRSGRADGHDVASEYLTGFPTVRGLGHQLSRDHASQDFEESLECLLDRIGRLHGT